MIEILPVLKQRLGDVDSTEAFEFWVRQYLRFHMPHAAFLVTLGRLYGVGSVPTHRFSVDFPLTLIENLKNRTGALDDPLLAGWFRNGKLRFASIPDVKDVTYRRWKSVLESFGVRSVLVDGILDHKNRRFAVFQACNPEGGSSLHNVNLFSGLVEVMADRLWAIIDHRTETVAQGLVGHPTLNLTAAEMQIVELLSRGLSNKEIARRRGVSDSTIKTQVQRTGAKVGATRRAEIVAIALPLLASLPAQHLLDYDNL